jgi:hypothetical protein
MEKKQVPIKDWEIFKAKGPVKNTFVQRQVDRIGRELKEFFTEEERGKLTIAQGHAFSGEGSGEWYNVCIDIENRWGDEGIFPRE